MTITISQKDLLKDKEGNLYRIREIIFDKKLIQSFWYKKDALDYAQKNHIGNNALYVFTGFQYLWIAGIRNPMDDSLTLPTGKCEKNIFGVYINEVLEYELIKFDTKRTA
jgi:hypothetical protein